VSRGRLQVLRSGFYLAQQRPLPHLLNDLYGGPVLVLQGVLDPLGGGKARARADTLEAAIPHASKVCLDAGHCPHDEVPELVNDAIAEFVDAVVAQAGTSEKPAVVHAGGQGAELEGAVL
jgi:pimeloyl-ACP methyl ester carboxylesterase